MLRTKREHSKNQKGPLTLGTYRAEVFGVGQMSRTRCTRQYSRVQRTFMLNFGIIQFIALATYFGRWGGNAAPIMMVKP